MIDWIYISSILFMFRSHSSRLTHLWYLFTWILVLFFCSILYHVLSAGELIRFTPDAWKYIDKVYFFVRGMLIVLIVANLASLFFREVKHAFSLEHRDIQKFLPLIRFVTLMFIWT